MPLIIRSIFHPLNVISFAPYYERLLSRSEFIKLFILLRKLNKYFHYPKQLSNFSTL